MDQNNKNFILAIVLSAGILLVWQVFYAGPQQKELERQRQEALKQQKAAQPKQQNAGNTAPTPGVPGAKISSAPAPIAKPVARKSREAVLGEAKRLKVETESLKGTIPLTGLRIDDLILRKYKETVKKNSPNVMMFSPAGYSSKGKDGEFNVLPYYSEHGWRTVQGSNIKVPDSKTVWTVEGNRDLTETTPVTLTYDNGQGIVFKRTLSVDKNYMITVKQEFVNKTGKPVTLYPYALISRHGKPKTEDFFIQHEGLFGVMGEQNLIEIGYSDALEEKARSFKEKAGWIGITDKYWAAVVIPDQSLNYEARFTGLQRGSNQYYQTDYFGSNGVTAQAGATGQITGHVFVGPKQTHLIDAYEKQLSIKRFDLMVDWGWFGFLTKPLFYALDYFFKMFGNFGVAILVVTVIIKLILFPLANKSYDSMSKMKKLQPEMQRIRERFKDDKMRQQKELMEMYKKEKINPMAGCLPVFIQIPVFFALYKVLFISIDMRHAPFFGWINDLSAPDPTNLFNLFGLLPFDPPFPFQVGIWAIIMGLTMWIQMRLNPQQADPVQQAIFNWMPIVFTFMLATFPAGLVIYWAWNNLLSIIQQYYIMRKNDVDVNLLENTGIDKLLSRFKSDDTGTGTKKT